MIDAVIAGVLAVLCLLIAGRDSIADWLWWALLCVPLVFRRRAPVLVYWTILGLALIQQLTTPTPSDYSMLLMLVTLYTVAAYKPRRNTWMALAGIEAVVLISIGLPSQSTQYLNDLIFSNLAIALVTVFGIYVSVRRAYLAGLVERAERLERESAQQAQLAVAAERARIAREMHDVVAHSLTVMVSLADGAAYSIATSPPLAAEAVQKLAATGRQSLGEMRRLLGLLHDGDVADPAMVPQPGFDDIDGLIDQVRAAGLRVVYTTTGGYGPWGAGPGLTVYRLIQESLTNILKHAGTGATAHVVLRYTPTGIDLDVTDDGEAISPARPGGHGLAGMAARAAAYGGQIHAGPRVGGGWNVTAKLNFDTGAPPT